MASKYLKEIESELLKFPQRTSAHVPENYIGGGQSKLQYMGLRVPHLHALAKKGFSFSHLDHKIQAKIWNDIWWKSSCFEVMSLALNWFYHPQQQEQGIQFWPILKKWSSKIDNWAHSDSLSAIYARYLEEDSSRIYPTLEHWNHSKNPWERRLSMVSLIYYRSQRDKILPFNKIIKLVEPHLHDEHYYVQKGVGWTLRETYNAYPQETFEYLTKNAKNFSAHAFSAATEKLSQTQKKKIKTLRKK